MALETEIAFIAKELPNLLRDPRNHGKYALVNGERVDSLWETIDDALTAGYDRFGLNLFFIKHVVEREEPVYFSRNLKPCR